MKYSMHQQYYDGSLPGSICTMTEEYNSGTTAVGYCIGGQGVEACVPHGGMFIHDGIMTPALSSSRKILCQVCGALSSGLHFGVFTCEGCKCFYRRSIKEGANYACAKDRNCDITMETRNSCRFCRFQKCLALGMSKEGIKLGRRPKVDSDVFQQGFYHAGEMDMLHSHGQQTYSWPGTDHLDAHFSATFKSEPAFIDLDGRVKDGYGEQPVMNYSMKREAYTTCDQHNGLHYPHQGSYLMPGQQHSSNTGVASPGRDQYEQAYGSPMESAIHAQQQHMYLPPDVPSHPHHSTPMSNPVPILHNPTPHPPSAQSRIEHGAARSWTAELSPTSSMSSGSEEAWEGTVYQANHPSSVTLTLPEVHSGAVAAMAYANLYRGKTDSPSSTSSSISTSERSKEDENAVLKKPSEMSFSLASETERGSRSYTELVPRKNNQKIDSVMQSVGERHESYANKLQAMQTSMALSPKPASPACGSRNDNNYNKNEAWVGHPDGRQQSGMNRGGSGAFSNLSHPGGLLKKGENKDEHKGDMQGDLLHNIMTYFLQLKMDVVAQWKVYCSKISSNDSADFNWKEVESFVNTTYEITNCIRNYVHKVLGLAQQNCGSGIELVWTSLAVVVKTCLLLDMSTHGQLKARGGQESPQLLKEEAVCISILALFSSVALSERNVLSEACQWICRVARDYLKEKCKTEERFQQVTQLLQGDSTAMLITSPS
ncbi:zygotic gap protein knirps-like [Acanthaster planci]|uniref:Zygotic gap protein knirps-like n=1 Tax=Acanthaster planci TaxID=133434 RepID=A0A8B7YDK4_ACAPL|nr:zygotic gap protein knirps-like [Acanthaster planci]